MKMKRLRIFILLIIGLSGLWGQEDSPAGGSRKIYGILGTMGATGTYDSTDFSGYPLLLYNHLNLWGTGHNLMIQFAGLYGRIDYEMPQETLLPIGLRVQLDGMFLPEEYNIIEGGRSSDWDVETPEYNACLEFDKNILPHTTLSSLHKATFRNYKGGIPEFTRPDNNFTYKGDLAIAYSTVQEGFPTAFMPPSGAALTFSPALVFKPDYKDWGPDNGLYTHDDLPGGMFRTSAAYHATPSERVYWGGRLTHYSSINNYKTEEWTFGEAEMLSSERRLSGYQSGEYRSPHAVTLNLDGHYQVLPYKLLVFARHDVLFDLDDERIKQGSALGCVFMLPYDIEMSAEGGVGWNAVRESGPGWNVRLNISRYFMR